jgi:isoleucyl-tRNA synthetase
MPESVHLCDYPKSDESKINLSLIDKVDALRRIIELGRSARNKANIKIRQPLAELAFFIKDDDVSNFIMDQQQVVLDELNIKMIKRVENETELIKYTVKPNLPLLGQKYGSELQTIKEKLSNVDENKLLKQIRNKNKYKIELKGKEIFLGRDDLIFVSESIDGYTSSGDDNFTVGLTVQLTADLIQEGIVRDIIRHVQTMRKNANFAVEDRIKIYALLDGPVGEAISSFEKLFKNEVLAVDLIKESKTGEYSESFQIGNQNVEFGIERI